MHAPAFDGRPTLHGPHLLLRPLQPEDAEPLYAAAADPLIWEQHPDPLRYRREDFMARFLAPALKSACALVVLDRTSGDIVGSSRYYDWDAARREVAIGYSFLARSHWGGDSNAEMKQLMLTHAFRQARRVWFHVGRDNRRSRRALEKIGARLSHEGLRHDQPHAWYSIDAPATAQNHPPRGHFGA